MVVWSIKHLVVLGYDDDMHAGGSSANLKFPVTSSHYIPDTVMSPKSIQRVAAAAANSENAAVTTTNPPISPTLPSSSSTSSSSSSSSLISSPSMSSSPSDQLLDDDVFLLQPIKQTYNEASISMMEPLPWYNFDGFNHLTLMSRPTGSMTFWMKAIFVCGASAS